MDKNNFSDKAAQAGKAIKDFARESMIRHDNELYNKGYNEGCDKQREWDVKSTIKAFLELKVKDQDIYKLLSKYFFMDSISEVSDLLNYVKKDKQYFDFREYCINNGMTDKEFDEYAFEHNLIERLYHDERFLEMQPEKMKAYFDRQ